MAVIINQSTGDILAEYAASSINFNRQVISVSGILTAVFDARIPYERKDYLLNANGEKIGLVSLDPIPSPGMPDNNRYGNIYLNPTQFAEYFSAMPDPTKSLGQQIADTADQLIHDDLVARGIIVVDGNA